MRQTIKSKFNNVNKTNNNNLTIKNTKNTTNTTLHKNNHDKLVISDVIDEQSYNHFKTLIASSNTLCNGKKHNGKSYKVHIALSKDYKTLKQQKHYRIIYIHNNREIFAYIAVKLYKRDGGFMFIHKICSTGGGYGTQLMNIILEDSKQNYIKLGITYLSLTTHNLDLIDYYNKFNPTRTHIVNNPGTKALQPKQVAYMIWQLSPNMPNLKYV